MSRGINPEKRVGTIVSGWEIIGYKKEGKISYFYALCPLCGSPKRVPSAAIIDGRPKGCCTRRLYHAKRRRDSWTKAVSHIKKYIEEHGHANIPAEYVDQSGFRLGQWINHVRWEFSKDMLTNEEIKTLVSLNLRIESKKQNSNRKGISIKSRWGTGLEYATEYYKQHGHLRVPYKYTADDGYNLGMWVYVKRKKYMSEQLSQEEISTLERIGMEWRLKKTISFEEWYDVFKTYYNKHGHLKVPRDHVTEDGYKLGSRVSNLRAAYKGRERRKITPEQIAAMEKIGMIWDASK